MDINAQFWDDLDWIKLSMPTCTMVSICNSDKSIKNKVLRSCDPESMKRYLENTCCVFSLPFVLYMYAVDSLLVIRGTSIEVYKDNRSIVIRARDRVPSDVIAAYVNIIRCGLEKSTYIIDGKLLR